MPSADDVLRQQAAADEAEQQRQRLRHSTAMWERGRKSEAARAQAEAERRGRTRNAVRDQLALPGMAAWCRVGV